MSEGVLDLKIFCMGAGFIPFAIWWGDIHVGRMACLFMAYAISGPLARAVCKRMMPAWYEQNQQ